MSEHLMAKIGQYALIDNNGMLLVLKRSRSKEWSLPGGRLEKEEAWDKAFIREIKKETNLDCENLKPFAVNILEDPYQIKYCVYFEVQTKNFEDLKLSNEHSEYKWIDKSNIENIAFEDEKVKKVVVDFLMK